MLAKNTHSPSPAPAAAPQTLARIHAVLPSLGDSERRVADAVLADPGAVVRKAAAKLGREADTSATTVVRFAQRLGFSGYTEMGIALVTGSAEAELRAEPRRSSGTHGIVEAITDRHARAVMSVCDALDTGVIDQIVECVVRASRVLCLGAALSTPVVADLGQRLNHLGFTSIVTDDPQLQRLYAHQLGPGDVCIVVLTGGLYSPVVRSAAAAAERGATVIAITAFAHTPLTQIASLSVCVGGETVRGFAVDASSGRIAFLTVVDIVIEAIRATDPVVYQARLANLTELIETERL